MQHTRREVMKLLTELREKEKMGASVISEASIIFTRASVLDQISDGELGDACGGIPRLLEVLAAAQRAAIAMQHDMEAFVKRAGSQADADAARSLIGKYQLCAATVGSRIARLRGDIPPAPKPGILVRPAVPLPTRPRAAAR
jgi:hypothetical protein